MKHLVIVADGMADHPVERLGGKTLLQFADVPNMDALACNGRTGRLVTIPDGFSPGSDVANSVILGYDQEKVYEGRGPLEAASIGYEMRPGDLALRVSLISVDERGRIVNHHGGHVTTQESFQLIDCLNAELADERLHFHTGSQYRHLLVIKGGNKHIECALPHDSINKDWHGLLVRPKEGYEHSGDDCYFDSLGVKHNRLSPEETSDILNDLILKSQGLLEKHKVNINRRSCGLPPANLIWPWGGGYRPSMLTLSEKYPEVRSGAVVSADNLIRGIGQYAGLKVVDVDGATGFADTNYEGKAKAAIDALRTDDFVFLHIEASDEAGHDGDLQLKLKTIEDIDLRVMGTICSELSDWKEPVCIALLPDHPTPVEMRTHVNEPVPFLVYYHGIKPDSVSCYDEQSCMSGSYGLLRLQEFMEEIMKIK